MASKKVRFTPLQTKWIEGYFIHHGNLTRASQYAGYSGDENAWGVAGYHNIRNPKIAAEIERRSGEMGMGANEVLMHLADIARGDISDFMQVSDTGYPLLDFKKAQAAGRLHLVKSISYGKSGLKFELYSKDRALETLAKHHGLLKDNLTIDVNLIVTAVEALKEAGFDPAETFQKMIERVQLERNRQTSG